MEQAGRRERDKLLQTGEIWTTKGGEGSEGGIRSVVCSLEATQCWNAKKYILVNLCDESYNIYATPITCDLRRRIIPARPVFFITYRYLKVREPNKDYTEQSFDPWSYTYASEICVMRSRNESLLNRWERKILRKVYGFIEENNSWRIRTNAEIYRLYE